MSKISAIHSSVMQLQAGMKAPKSGNSNVRVAMLERVMEKMMILMLEMLAMMAAQQQPINHQLQLGQEPQGNMAPNAVHGGSTLGVNINA